MNKETAVYNKKFEVLTLVKMSMLDFGLLGSNAVWIDKKIRFGETF
jgi:hypothetical protein